MVKNGITEEAIQNLKKDVYKQLKVFNNTTDEEFNSSAITMKLYDDYNFVVWCDIDENNHRYYIVSIRYNPEDDCFGRDIGAEWCTEGTGRKEFYETVNKVLDLFEQLKGEKK